MNEPDTAPVPPRYRGVWCRTLLETPTQTDTTTTVFWLQTSRWHADLRIPADRPDFSHVQSLCDCSPQQQAWLATQQGFAGVTQVDATRSPEICTWHRAIDFQPASTAPDAGFMRFEQDRLIETGMHGAYLEHWAQLPDSRNGFAVFRALNGPEEHADALALLLIAGNYVMRVRSRVISIPDDTKKGTALIDLIQSADAALLDFEISIGRRTQAGWTIEHSTLPPLEGRTYSLHLNWLGANRITLACENATTTWEVLEWSPPESLHDDDE